MCKAYLLRLAFCISKRLQELLKYENHEEGRVPRTVECELTEDLVDGCIPGDVVTVTGFVKVINNYMDIGGGNMHGYILHLFESRSFKSTYTQHRYWASYCFRKKKLVIVVLECTILDRNLNTSLPNIQVPSFLQIDHDFENHVNY